MEPRFQATEIVRRAEGEMRQLLLRTAEQGDYEAASLLAEWAKQLKQMAQDNGLGDSQPSRIDSGHGNGQSHAGPECAAPTLPNRTITNGTHARRHSRAKNTKTGKREYPKFLRDGEELLKIGWSKREKKVYRHKAPQQVVLLVSQAIQKAGQHGERFVMEQILPIRDPENDSDVPSYQTYLSLAWLRKEDLIVRHGRQGYSLRPKVNLVNAVEERWKLLPKS